MLATGEFEVNLKPLKAFTTGNEGTSLGRMSIDKIFTGDLEAKSQGEMLTARTTVEGSAGYVAIEHVIGTLQGKSGTFALQHFGLMSQGQNRLILEVVPDSGAGELAGLSGSMAIKIEDGQHFYEFEYSMG